MAEKKRDVSRYLAYLDQSDVVLARGRRLHQRHQVRIRERLKSLFEAQERPYALHYCLNPDELASSLARLTPRWKPGLAVGRTLREAFEKARERWPTSWFYFGRYPERLTDILVEGETRPGAEATIGPLDDDPSPNMEADWSWHEPVVTPLLFKRPGGWQPMPSPGHFVDTAYGGYLMVPFSFICEVDEVHPWTWCGARVVGMADGRRTSSALFIGTIQWPPDGRNGRPFRVIADVTYPSKERRDREGEKWIEDTRRTCNWLIGCQLLAPGTISLRSRDDSLRERRVYLWSDNIDNGSTAHSTGPRP